MRQLLIGILVILVGALAVVVASNHFGSSEAEKQSLPLASSTASPNPVGEAVDTPQLAAPMSIEPVTTEPFVESAQNGTSVQDKLVVQGDQLSDNRTVSINEVPPEAIAKIRQLGFEPFPSNSSYNSYDTATLKQLAASGDGIAANRLAVDGTIDRQERVDFAIVAAQAGAPAALWTIAQGEFANPSYLPEGYESLDDSYVLHLVAKELLDGQVKSPQDGPVLRYESHLSERELAAAHERAEALLADIRGL